MVVQVLHNFRTLTIHVGVGKRFVDWPLYARTSPSFHGDPWYSDVTIQMEPKGHPKEIKYAQLQLFFNVDLFQTFNNALVIKELALVCICQKVPPNKLSRLIMCEEIKWALTI